MSEIVKICKVHGNLNIDQIKIRNDNGQKICIACLKEYEKKRVRPENHYEDYVKVKSREWRQKNSDLVNNRVADDRLINPEKYREYDRKWRRENLEKSRYMDILVKHKISLSEYEELLDNHSNLCAICKKQETKKSRTEGQICKLCIDHCHECERNKIKGLKSIRGLLCHNCNAGIGHFLDNIDLLKSAIQYLESHEH